jgi:hypothetical protein
MKPDEVIFFAYCYVLRTEYKVCVRDVVNMFEGIIHHKRCWYLLSKWANKFGFYNYGVTLDLGWFDEYKLPECYVNIIDNIKNMVIETIEQCIKGSEVE